METTGDQVHTEESKVKYVEKASEVRAFQHGVSGRLAAEAGLPISARQDEEREKIW